MLTASTRVVDVRPENRVKTVTKLEGGDLRVEQHSGEIFTVSQDDELFQAFVIYSILADL